MNNQPNRPSPPTTLYPLTKYTRELKVEEQASQVLTATRSEALRRLRIVRVNDPDALLDETLLSLARHYLRIKYHADFIDSAMKTLTQRAKKTAYNHARNWHQMSQTEREDYAEDTASDLIGFILDVSEKEEFGEVRYGKWLYWKALNTSRPYEKFSKMEEEEITYSSQNSDEEYNRLERAEDFSLPDMDSKLFWEAALQTLTDNERKAFILDTLEDVPQDLIAKKLGYTSDRMVRLLVSRAKTKLKTWFDSH